MADRPILFSGPMIRALLAGTKTQTRRVVKPQPDVDARFFDLDVAINMKGEPAGLAAWFLESNDGGLPPVFCPYGQPGDRLWVRESFWGCDLPGYGDQPCVVYEDEWNGKEYRPAEPRPWARKFGHIPGIHMPRDASRITLEVTGVRVERLQDISEADAIAEGCVMLPARHCYEALWESIHGPGSWDANPWVWVVEFKRVTP